VPWAAPILAMQMRLVMNANPGLCSPG